MDGGQHRHAHAGGLLRGIGLGTAHLTHHQDIRVEAQADIHQRDLIDPLTGKNKRMLVAFLYLDKEIHPFADMEKAMTKALNVLRDKA